MIDPKRVTIALAMACIAGAASAQQGEEAAMSAEQQAMMEAWRKAAETTPHHDWLMQGAGDWNVKQKVWMEPDTEPLVNEARAQRDVLLGGRVLQEKFTGTFMGQPFNGLGHSGYDNVTGKYWATWVDNMSTALYSGDGTCKKDRSHCTYLITGSDPMTGDAYEMRIEVEYDHGVERHHFHETRDGEEMKTMLMVYTPAE